MGLGLRRLWNDLCICKTCIVVCVAKIWSGVYATEVSGIVVMADFGLACRISEAGDWFAGTPEVLREKHCGTEGDMWSVDINVDELLMDKLPFGLVSKKEANFNFVIMSLDGLGYWCRSFLDERDS